MRRGLSGQMLIVTFWMIGLVSVAVGTLVMWAGHEARLGRLPLEIVHREAVADAAIQQALALMLRDDEAIDHLGEAWATGEEAGAQIFTDIAVGHGMFRVGVMREDGDFAAGLIDEERKINLRHASTDVLGRLIGFVGRPETDPQELAEAIRNWRTADDPELGACAEPQRCHNGLFDSVDELRLVPGMTPELFDALAPYVTVYPLTGASVNINTAPAIVLDAMNCPGTMLVAQREANNPPALSPSLCSGTGAVSSAFTVSVEAWLTTSSLHTRLHAVTDRDGNILSWFPQ